MRVLTPSGYKSPVSLANGDDVCAFDAATGAAIVNAVENIDFVDYAEWCRWWQCEETVPPFNWVHVNGSFLLFCEQSIWRNGTNVCHARDLVVGDEIYDDEDRPITITSIEVSEDRDRVWYRFDISGDHCYIVDGLTVHNASRFWVGGTGSLTPSNTANWSAATGGTTGASVPGSADTATWDVSSGGGTTTLNFGGTWTVQSVTMGAFTGTWDNSVNNNNVTVSANGNAFNGSGAGARAINLGAATYTLTSSGSCAWQFGTATNLTYSGSSANIVFSGASNGIRSIQSSTAGLSHGNVTFGPTSGSGRSQVNGTTVANITLASLSITAPNYVEFPSSAATTITAALNWAGSSSAQIGIAVFSPGSSGTINVAAGSLAQWCAFRDVTFTGSPSASSSFDLGNNSGITITAPSVGGGGSGFGVVGS